MESQDLCSQEETQPPQPWATWAFLEPLLAPVSNSQRWLPCHAPRALRPGSPKAVALGTVLTGALWALAVALISASVLREGRSGPWVKNMSEGIAAKKGMCVLVLAPHTLCHRVLSEPS